MGRIRAPLPVKLIVPMLSARPAAFVPAEEALAARYGPLDYRSSDIPFGHTGYYEEELGPGLVRRIVALRDLIDPGALAAVKVWTNALEERLAVDGRRTVNLDPGYVCGGKLVLATTKDQAHRVYLGGGIYAEVTLVYRDRAWRVQPWTYPDYASPAYHTVFEAIRSLYMAQWREGKSLPSLHDQADV